MHTTRAIAIGAACAVLLLASAAGAQPAPDIKIALLPLAAGAPPLDANRQAFDCREPELIAESRLADGAPAAVTACLQQALEKALPGRMVPANERAGADGLLAYMKQAATLKAHGLKLADKVQAGQVLVGTVLRYRERKGTAYGADKPAAVAFSLYLLDAKSGEVLWSGAFDKVQQSLSENVLDAPAFFRHGAKWLTAKELACRGAEDVADNLKSFLSGREK